MTKFMMCVYTVILGSILLPCSALGQGSEPPICCISDGGGKHSVAPPTAPAIGASQNYVAISDGSLQAMGMSRSDFVDRLAGSLFFGRNVDLLVSVSLPIEARARTLRESGDPDVESATAEGILLSVEEKRLYRIPRARLRAADIEALDRLSITDGQTYIEIEFTKAGSSGAIR